METTVVRDVLWRNRYRVGRDAPEAAFVNVAAEVVAALADAHRLVDLAAQGSTVPGPSGTPVID